MVVRRLRSLAALLLGLAATVAHAQAPALDLARYRGKVVYVDFWASWCAPCKQAFPFMAKLSRHYPARDVVVLTINEERQRAAGEAFLRQAQSSLPVIWDADGAIAKAWAVNEMPVTLLFDRKGKMRFRHQGFAIDKTAQVQAQLDTLVAEH